MKQEKRELRVKTGHNAATYAVDAGALRRRPPTAAEWAGAAHWGCGGTTVTHDDLRGIRGGGNWDSYPGRERRRKGGGVATVAVGGRAWLWRKES